MAWIIANPYATGRQDADIVIPSRIVGGSSGFLRLSPRLITPEGELLLRYANLDPEKSTVVIQEADGPVLMFGSVSFLNNYARVCALLLLQVMFMTTLGCATGASLSTPMAVFVSITYIFFGLLVRLSKKYFLN